MQQKVIQYLLKQSFGNCYWASVNKTKKLVRNSMEKYVTAQLCRWRNSFIKWQMSLSDATRTNVDNRRIERLTLERRTLRIPRLPKYVVNFLWTYRHTNTLGRPSRQWWKKNTKVTILPRNTLDCDQSTSHIVFSHIPTEFGQTGISAIRSADPENPTLEPNTE